MKEEKEILWIANLLTTKNLSHKKRGGTFKEFESVANNSYLDKDFRKWFKKMLDVEAIKFLEYKNNNQGKPTKIYLIDYPKMFKHLNQFELFDKLYDISIDYHYAVPFKTN